MPKRVKGPGVSPPVLERSGTTRGALGRARIPKGVLEEEHRLVKNTANARGHQDDPRLKSQAIPEDQYTVHTGRSEITHALATGQGRSRLACH